MELLTKKEKLTSMDPDWANMPTEILELVCKRFSLPDQLLFGSVCSSWRSCTSNKAYIWVPDFPWLVTNNDNYRPKFILYRFTYTSTDKKMFKIDKPFNPLHGPFIVGSFKGWLVIRSEVEVFILNLFSHIRIELPPRSSMPDVLKAKGTKSSGMDIPLAFAMTTCDEFNPIIVATVTSGGDLAWCKIGDKAWKGHRGGDGEEYVNLTFHKEKLYAIRRDGSKIDMFQVEDESPVLLLLGSIDYPPHPADQAPSPTSQPLHFYLVECKGSLLVVRRYFNYSRLNMRTVHFHILKVEENYSQHKLVNVDNLDGQALFVNDLNSESFSPQVHHQRDCIFYIAHSANKLTFELRVFLVNKSGRHQFRIPHTIMESPFWVMPRFAFECKCKCHDSTLWRCKEMHTVEN